MIARKYRSPDERRLVAWAVDRGWRIGRRSRRNHLLLEWPPSGRSEPIPGTVCPALLRSTRTRLMAAESE